MVCGKGYHGLQIFFFLVPMMRCIGQQQYHYGYSEGVPHMSLWLHSERGIALWYHAASCCSS